MLLSKLPQVLDITATEIARRGDINQQVMTRYITGQSVINIQVLLKLCNAIRMPIHFFVAENQNYIIPNRETATIPLDDWNPVSWNFANVERIFGDGKGEIQWKDVAVAMGSSSQKPHERFSLRRRFKVNDFFTACNAFDLSPFLFFNDPNRPSTSNKKQPKSKARKSKPSLPSYDELSEKVGKLEEGIADLTQKFQDLLQKYEALEQRMRVNIQNVHNSHIGINDHMDMAADTRPDK